MQVEGIRDDSSIPLADILPKKIDIYFFAIVFGST